VLLEYYLKRLTTMLTEHHRRKLCVDRRYRRL
jgi:hypothetical protein